MSAAAHAALAVVGSRFRLHGRDPATGLDCVGVAAAAARANGYAGAIPSGYALRGGDPARIVAALDAALARAAGERPGDIVLMRAGPAQLHLGVIVDGGMVHADAALRRVVLRPGPPGWPMIGAWTFGEDYDGDLDPDDGRRCDRRTDRGRDRRAGGPICR